jgi:hypothetical protein
MIAAAWSAWDAFFGRGDAAVTVPVMDGPLKPNRALDAVAHVGTAAGIDNLLRTADGVRYTSGASLLSGAGDTLAVFDQTITCAAVGPDGTVALGLEGGGLEGGGVALHGGARDGRRIQLARGPLGCLTAAVFTDARTLLVAQGSNTRPAAAWRHDLMQRGQSGSIWRIDLDSGAATMLRGRLAWPWGLALARDGRLFVAESWRHRVLLLDADSGSGADTGSGNEVALGDLPGYPARIVPARRGGYWLAFASVRNQLVELILREPGYRTRMMAEVPEAYWMAPALSSGGSFLEPLQGSGLKQMGQMKPWAATRSYGLVVRCDAAMQPVRSWHSRADGRAHGIVSLCEDGPDLLAAAKGPGWLLRLDGVADETVGAAP